MPSEVQVGEKVLVKEAEAIAAMLVGGYVMFCSGAMLSPDANVPSGNVLGTLSIKTSTSAGADVVMQGLHGTAERGGELRWFRACDQSGATVMQGKVAVKGVKADAPLLVSRLDTLPGDRYDISSAVLSVRR